MPSNRKPILVSFSGLDGSGKSTQIENLRSTLEASGRKVVLLAFWDNVVVGTGWREGFVHKAYGSQRGIGAPGKPVERRDKNVRRWYLTLARHVLYFIDALHLIAVVGRAKKELAGTGEKKGESGAPGVLILDRYVYDELSNLPLTNPLTGAYIKLVHALVPRPDIAYLLDADPVAARARKPEYPVDFMRKCRAAYFGLAGMLGSITVIPPLPLEEAKRAVIAAFERATRSKLASPAADALSESPSQVA